MLEDNKEFQENNKENKEIQNEPQQNITTEQLQQELENRTKEIQNLNSQILRLKAEFDNYRKRVEKENHKKFILGKEFVLIKLIELIDIFETALESMNKTDNIKTVIEGVELLKKGFIDFIDKEGLKPIKSIGEKFNPKFHEVIGTEFSDESEENIIIKELQKGYIFDNEHIIRPAKVIVSTKNKIKQNSKNKKEEQK